MSDDDSSETMEDASYGLWYDGDHVFLCSMLQQHDPDVTDVSITKDQPAQLTNQRARLLGESLQGNPHVAELQLKISLLEEERGDENNDSVALLLRFIRESRELRMVRLSGLPDLDDSFDSIPVSASILRRFFLAIAESPTIQFLRLDHLTSLQPEGFDVLMKTTRSLKTLIVDSSDFFSAPARDNMAAALVGNQTLERLQIGTDFAEPVLLRMGSHLRLLLLSLTCSEYERHSYMDALACFLRSSQTLKVLDLCRYKFNKDLFQPLLEGIRSSPSLTILSWRSCKFDEESTALFQHILEPKKDSSCIRELRFGRCNTFYRLSTGTMVVNILAPSQAGENGSKAGKITSLDCLDMSGSHNDDFAAVCDALGSNPTGIHLRRLCCGGIDTVGYDALIRCLPKLLFLKQLSIDFVVDRVSWKNLLPALRQNGSLEKVAVRQNCYFLGPPLFREQSYCKRNQAIPPMVAKPWLDAQAGSATDLCLFPALFAAAKQAPRTAPTVMLSGLLNAGGSVGAKCAGKRLHPDKNNMAIV